jgi:hypothetical protein
LVVMPSGLVSVDLSFLLLSEYFLSLFRILFLSSLWASPTSTTWAQTVWASWPTVSFGVSQNWVCIPVQTITRGVPVSNLLNLSILSFLYL